METGNRFSLQTGGKGGSDHPLTPLDFVENDGNWKGEVWYNGKIDEHHGNTLLHRGTWRRKSVNSPLRWVSQSSLKNPNETTSNMSTWPNANSFPKGIPTSDPHKPNEMAAAKVMVWLDPCANKRLHELLIGGWLETTTPSTKSWLRLVNLSLKNPWVNWGLTFHFWGTDHIYQPLILPKHGTNGASIHLFISTPEVIFEHNNLGEKRPPLHRHSTTGYRVTSPRKALPFASPLWVKQRLG